MQKSTFTELLQGKVETTFSEMHEQPPFQQLQHQGVSMVAVHVHQDSRVMEGFEVHS